MNNNHFKLNILFKSNILLVWHNELIRLTELAKFAFMFGQFSYYKTTLTCYMLSDTVKFIVVHLHEESLFSILALSGSQVVKAAYNYVAVVVF